MGSSRSVTVGSLRALPHDFLLRSVGFNSDNKPIITTQVDDTLNAHELLGRHLSLSFDMSVRYCTGWFDMEQRQAYACPERACVEGKFERCITCRNKTGFNPAFYYAKTVSKQQEIINQHPHFVYLAYFAPGLVKVGISQEVRGIRRLLEQGARVALKLDTFPTAAIARQYEAKISHLDGVVEHVIHSRKIASLTEPFDEVAAMNELQAVKERIERAINVTFGSAEIIRTAAYFHSTDLNLENVLIMKNESTILGTVHACIGSDTILEHGERLLAYNLKAYVGYRARISDDIELELPSEQLALFCYNRPMRRTGE